MLFLLKRRVILSTLLCGAVLASVTVLSPTSLQAEPLGRRPAVVVQPETSVMGARYRLGDIARISADDEQSKQLADQLAGIDLGMSPDPGQSLSVDGARVLEAIESTGHARDSFRYSIPQKLSVVRPGRALQESDISQVVRDMLAKDTTASLSVREIKLNGQYTVPLGPLSVKAERLGELVAGKLPLRVTVSIPGGGNFECSATAIVDDWRMVPVLRHPLDRGAIIRAEDLELFRVNLLTQPADILLTLDSVVGKKVKGVVTAGDILRDSAVETPPLIAKGRAVVIVYQIAGLRATATGTALDDGQAGERIRVRNESSKKVLHATVSNGTEVQVEAL